MITNGLGNENPLVKGANYLDEILQYYPAYQAGAFQFDTFQVSFLPIVLTRKRLRVSIDFNTPRCYINMEKHVKVKVDFNRAIPRMELF